LGEVVDFARRSEGIDLTQSGEHALTDFFAFTLALDDLKVLVAVRVFDADEQCLCSSPLRRIPYQQNKYKHFIHIF
jgi:hypothetical protein